MERRQLLKTLMGGTALAGLSACPGGGGIAIPPVPISVKLPANVSTFISSVNDIISKIDSLSSQAGPEITDLENQAKGLVTQITGGGNAASLGSTLLGILGSVAGFLPPPYGLVASAIVALIPDLANLVGAVRPALAPKFHVRSVMTTVQAWQVIHSR